MQRPTGSPVERIGVPYPPDERSCSEYGCPMAARTGALCNKPRRRQEHLHGAPIERAHWFYEVTIDAIRHWLYDLTDAIKGPGR